jgi:hypothetical protein
MESEAITLLKSIAANQVAQATQVEAQAVMLASLIARVDRLEGKSSTTEDLKPSIDEDLKPSGDEDLKPSSDEDLKPSTTEDLKPSGDEDSKPSIDEPVIPKKVKKLPKKIKKLILQKEYYTPEEVDKMDNFVLCREFIRLTGHQTLHCCHCGKKETALDNWITSIRKRCLKPAGLSKDTVPPKTCDKKQAVNSICNPINNRVYPVLRSNKTSNEKKERYKYAKKVCFELIGKATKKPYKY